MDDNQAQEIWEEYAFFTREMVKFFKKNDVDMFLTLQAEQEELYQKLATIPDDDFAKTPEGKAMMKEVFENLQILKFSVSQWLNDARAKQSVSNAYDNLGKTMGGQLRKWNG